MSLRYSRSEANGGFSGQLVKWLLKSPWSEDSEYTRLISKETHSVLPAYTDYPIYSAGITFDYDELTVLPRRY